MTKKKSAAEFREGVHAALRFIPDSLPITTHNHLRGVIKAHDERGEILARAHRSRDFADGMITGLIGLINMNDEFPPGGAA